MVAKPSEVASKTDRDLLVEVHTTVTQQLPVMTARLNDHANRLRRLELAVFGSAAGALALLGILWRMGLLKL